MENNNKPWFEEHKAVYQKQVLEPLKALALALTPPMHQVDPKMDFRPQKMISRIYRDIRFSPDKTPYKRHMWLSFQRPFDKQTPDWETFPGFYMEVGEEGINYGMGMWQAKKVIMDRYRDMVAYDTEGFREMTEDLIYKHRFEMGGEEYKRPIKSDLPEYFQPWIQRKGIHLHKNYPTSGEYLYSDELVDFMVNEFILLKPLYEFFVDVCE